MEFRKCQLCYPQTKPILYAVHKTANGITHVISCLIPSQIRSPNYITYFTHHSLFIKRPFLFACFVRVLGHANCKGHFEPKTQKATLQHEPTTWHFLFIIFFNIYYQMPCSWLVLDNCLLGGKQKINIETNFIYILHTFP